MSRFEWDEDNNRPNRRKHGISFEEASTIFDGYSPLLTAPDQRALHEAREITFGLLRGAVLVCVVHTDREGVIRIISARKATRKERRLFHDRLG